MFIIGSWALLHRAKQLGVAYRKPRDLDIICSRAEMEKFCASNGLVPSHLQGPHYIARNAPIYGNIEFLLNDKSLAAAAYTGYIDAWLKTATFRDTMQVYHYRSTVIAPLEVLYSLKRSHRFLPHQWKKNIADYHFIKPLVDDIDKIPTLTKMKSDETKKIKTPSLKKTKDDFFDDHVSNHTFEHDQIHEIMAHLEKPMFEYIKLESDKVTCSKEKFFALDRDHQLECVLEEAYVIALERGIIPMLYEGKKFAESESALRWALMRICTTLCSGWFRDFAVENYPNIWAQHDKAYVAKFLNAVDTGRIKRIDK